MNNLSNSYLLIILLLCFTLANGCRKKEKTDLLNAPASNTYGGTFSQLEPEEFHNRVLGALVGSAIGDAMGASTEMWDRENIQRTYGYIVGLTPAVRYQSPEGTWDHNLVAGSTTDDTRWKSLMADYIVSNRNDLGPEAFTGHIVNYYQNIAQQIKQSDLEQHPEVIDAPLEQMDWVREWVRVAMAYQQGPETFLEQRDRFYGGEMSCAGMLYAPVFGLTANTPEAAYNLAYAHSLFDLGYARDITALTAAMTQMALQTQSSDSLLNTAIFTDPKRFQDSRLVGRISLDLALKSRDFVHRARKEGLDNMGINEEELPLAPKYYPGSNREWAIQYQVYELLEADQKAIAFHAGEIWQILIAALEFGQGDFLRTMQFIVNYGRDNDTVAAVAGFILGAQLGFDRLPEKEKQKVLQVNKELLGIDLQAKASLISGFTPTALNE